MAAGETSWGGSPDPAAKSGGQSLCHFHRILQTTSAVNSLVSSAMSKVPISAQPWCLFKRWGLSLLSCVWGSVRVSSVVPGKIPRVSLGGCSSRPGALYLWGRSHCPCRRDTFAPSERAPLPDPFGASKTSAPPGVR